MKPRGFRGALFFISLRFQGLHLAVVACVLCFVELHAVLCSCCKCFVVWWVWRGLYPAVDVYVLLFGGFGGECCCGFRWDYGLYPAVDVYVLLFGGFGGECCCGFRWDYGLYPFSSPCYGAFSSVGAFGSLFNSYQACQRSQRAKARSLHLKPSATSGGFIMERRLYAVWETKN